MNALDGLHPRTDIRTGQSLSDHPMVFTLLINLHVMKRPGVGAASPLNPP